MQLLLSAGYAQFQTSFKRMHQLHDLRHQAITELAEGRASDATLMPVACHMSREILEHYSRVRMGAKREALAKLAGGLMVTPADSREPVSGP
ncbi:MAG: hypothetical protein ACKV22_32410 [Bryobacteraceae bacterium]